jgi:hypothetical protein
MGLEIRHRYFADRINATGRVNSPRSIIAAERFEDPGKPHLGYQVAVLLSGGIPIGKGIASWCQPV